MKELFVLSLNGMRYGVWKDSLLSVEDIQTLHRLPLSPACIAGMTILDGRTATLADLSVCLGLPKIAREKSGHILLMSREAKVAGFVVEGEIGHLTLAPEAVRPIPDYLRTAVIDTCAVHETEPIPVINISLLFSRIQKAETEPPIAEFRVPAAEHRQIASVKSVRLFESGKELFAAPAAGIEEESVTPGRISRIPLVPPYIKGLSFLHESVLPLISLARKMKLPKTGDEPLVLVAEIGGERFAFTVDADAGSLFGKDFTIKPFPPLVESNWIRGAVLRSGEILPLIDLGALMSARADGADERPLPERYSPDSPFPSIFGKEDVELVEFSLLGARHALPKSEVEDSVHFRPYRQVPNVQPIVVGVTEYNGGLLPVLDLAMCFGRRSLVTPEWSMLLVKNGDFRALVITEAVFGERRLEKNTQRGVPMVLPHRVVYGCYPDAAVVRLVLNVEALAVHFDKALVKDLLRALSKEMEQAPSEIVSSLLEPDVVGAQASREASVFAQEIVTEESDAPYDAAVNDEEQREEEKETVIAAQEQIEEPVLSATVAGAASEEIVHAPVRTAEVATTTEPASAPQPQPEPERVPVQTEPPAAPIIDEIERSGAFAGKESVREEQSGGFVPQDEQATHSPEEDRANAENPEPLVEEETGRENRSDDSVSEKVSEEAFSLTADTIADADHGETVPSPLQEETSVPVSYELPIEEHIPEQVVSPVRSETEEIGEVKTAGAQETFAIPEQPMVQRDYKRDGRIVERPVAGYPPASSLGRGKGKFVFACIAALLLAALFLSGVFNKAVIVRKEQEPRTGKVAVEKQKTAARPPIRKPAPVEPPKPVVAAEGPTLIPKGSKVYVVKEGDTLWAISQRFTGNPFNFPQVAKNNNIKNPDLIFPGQEIRL